MEDLMTTQNPIKANLKRLGWTISAVAEKMGVAQPTVTSIVTGNPTLAKVQAIADIVGCSVTDLLRDEASDAPRELTLSINGQEYTYQLKQ